MSSSRAITTRKYAKYYIISTFEAAISRGHKHGCLVKPIDSFLVITASCTASLEKALVRTKFSPYWQKFDSFSDSGRVIMQSSRSVGVCQEFLFKSFSILLAGTRIKTRYRPAEYYFSAEGK